MSEKTLSFGPEGSLAGILTEPSPGDAVEGAPAVLMWNVGMNHHVGPWRFNVELSRRMARVGIPSLRFDVSGIGDSEAQRDTRSDHERAVAEVREAMHTLERRKVARQFVLLGFCSSVDAAHVVAAEDPRVTACVYIEGYSFRTRGFWMRYPLRFVDRTRIRRYLKVHHPEVFGRELANRDRSGDEQVFEREYPSRDRLRRDFARMVQDGKRLLFVHVGREGDFNHAGQFHEMYGSPAIRGKVDVDYYQEMDHTFFRLRDRQQVLDRVASWVAALGARQML